jgi:hypothetical protein
VPVVRHLAEAALTWTSRRFLPRKL